MQACARARERENRPTGSGWNEGMPTRSAPLWRSEQLSTANKRGMGRGLAAILPQPGEVTEPALRHVPPALILPNPSQPRKHFDEESISALAESLRICGH